MAAGAPVSHQAGDVWIWGYGSLIWRPSFEWTRRVEGRVLGYRRVFWQGSTDHRGVPGAPGRVATIVESKGGEVWGAAYMLAGTKEQQEETLRLLEIREIQYNLRVRLPVYGKESNTKPILPSALVYIADNTPVNQNWLGPASLEEIALQIATSRGPSGPNDVYVFRLAEAVRQMGVVDEELEWLAHRVKEINALRMQN